MSKYNDVIERACNTLNPRAHYAHDVIRGHRRWSGEDLRGNARKWFGGYARQRGYARAALYLAGGCIVALRQSGRLVTAVPCCIDDYGNQVYATNDAYVIPWGRARVTWLVSH